MRTARRTCGAGGCFSGGSGGSNPFNPTRKQTPSSPRPHVSALRMNHSSRQGQTWTMLSRPLLRDKFSCPCHKDRCGPHKKLWLDDPWSVIIKCDTITLVFPARSFQETLPVALVVQKFGGTSVATADRIKAAARRAIRAHQAGNQVIVVVSARGDTTDDLIELAEQITERPPAREMDMLLATGEQISIALLAMAIHTLGQPAVSFTGAQVGIVTDSTHTKARIKSISTDRLRQALAGGSIVIVAGFQGIDAQNNITT